MAENCKTASAIIVSEILVDKTAGAYFFVRWSVLYLNDDDYLPILPEWCLQWIQVPIPPSTILLDMGKDIPISICAGWLELTGCVQSYGIPWYL
jgi:hypothetical protein